MAVYHGLLAKVICEAAQFLPHVPVPVCTGTAQLFRGQPVSETRTEECFLARLSGLPITRTVSILNSISVEGDV
jgi:hypothetical protein